MPDPRSPIALAFAEMWRQRGDLAASVVCGLGERFLLLSLPLLVARMVESVATADGSLRGLAAIAAIAVVGVAGLRALGEYFSSRAHERTARALRLRLVGHALRLPTAAIADRRPGELTTILGARSEAIVHYASAALMSLPPIALTAGGAVVMLALLDRALAAVAVVAIAIAVLGMRLARRRVRPAVQDASRTAARVEGQLNETLELLPAIKAFSSEARHAERHGAALDDLLRARLRQQRSFAWYGAASYLIAAAAVFAVVLIGAQKLDSGSLRTSELVSSLLYALVLLGPLSSLADLYSQRSVARAAAHDIDGILAAALEDHETGTPLPAGNGALGIRDLGFSYPGRPPLFDGLCLEIAAGETVALVGPNGAGKTTLFRLLLRFLEPGRGQISFDGQNLADLNVIALRDAISLVDQEDRVVFGTLRDNIDFGREPLDDAAVREAARRAGLDELIATLPQGIDTFVGADGAALSGGQRRRLQLARALARKPRLMLLDEPTAMLDEPARQAFVTAARENLAEPTVIIATHDRDLIALADRTIELPRGAALGAK